MMVTKMSRSVFIGLLVLFIAGEGTVMGFLDFDFDDIFDMEAEMIPDDVFMFVGDATKVYCYSKSSDFQSNDVLFKLFVNSVPRVMNSTVINSTHVMTIVEGTEEMKGRLTLSCIDRKTEKELSTSIQILLQEPLANVTDISSIYFYPNNTIEVSWNHPASYFQPQFYIETEVFWSPNDLSRDEEIGQKCHNLTYTKCIVHYYNFQSILVFHIKVTLRKPQLEHYRKSKEYFVHPQDREFPYYVYLVRPKTKVRTDSPKEVKVEGVTSRCCNISWTPPTYFRYFIHEENVYRIFAKQQGHSFHEVVNTTLELSEEATKMVQVCSLAPHTYYLLRIQVKRKEGGYWSEPSETTTKTLEDIPDYGPPMTSTSFWVGMCDDNKREIILYWKDLESRYRNGDLTNFLVFFNSESGEVRGSNNHVKASMACDVTYNVQVFSSTDVGRTPNPSTLMIPSENDAFQTPYLVRPIIEKLSVSPDTHLVSVNATWMVDDLKPFQDVTLVLYYCQGPTFNTRVCIDDFQFKEVDFEMLYLKLDNISQNVNQFGFALVKDENHLTGITWIDCIYDREEKPGQVTGVNTFPGEERGSIRVVWDAQRCSKETLSLLQGYYVKYCTPFQRDKGLNCPEEYVIGGDMSSVVLQGLDENQEYIISVCADAWSGTGLYSTPVVSHPSSSSEDDSRLNPIIVVAATLGVLTASCVVFMCWWKIRQRKKKMDKMMYPYTAFDCVTPGKILESQQSDDSGINSNSTPVISNVIKSYEQFDEIDPYVNQESSGQSNPVGQVDCTPVCTLQNEGRHAIPTRSRTNEDNLWEPKSVDANVEENSVAYKRHQERMKLGFVQSADGATGNTRSSVETDTDAYGSNPSQAPPYSIFNLVVNKNGSDLRSESQEKSQKMVGGIETSTEMEKQSDSSIHVPDLGNFGVTTSGNDIRKDEIANMTKNDYVSRDQLLDRQEVNNQIHSDAYMHISDIGNFEAAAMDDNIRSDDIADTIKNDYVARDEPLTREEVSSIESHDLFGARDTSTDAVEQLPDTNSILSDANIHFSDHGYLETATKDDRFNHEDYVAREENMECSVDREMYPSGSNSSHSDAYMHVSQLHGFKYEENTDNNYYVARNEPLKWEGSNLNIERDASDSIATGSGIETDTHVLCDNRGLNEDDTIFTPNENGYVTTDLSQNLMEMSPSTKLDDSSKLSESSVTTDTEGSNSTSSYSDAYVQVGAVGNIVLNSNYIPSAEAAEQPIKCNGSAQEDDAIHVAFKGQDSSSSHMNESL